MPRRVQFEHWIAADTGRVFLFFANPENLPRIMPPQTATRLLAVSLVAPTGAPEAQCRQLAGIGSEVVTSFRLFPRLPFHATWIARITEFEWNHHFADLQVRGPFHRFHHRHEFSSEVRDGKKGTMVRDVIEYEAGYGLFGKLLEKFIAGELRETFKYRQQAVEKLLVV